MTPSGCQCPALNVLFPMGTGWPIGDARLPARCRCSRPVEPPYGLHDRLSGQAVFAHWPQRQRPLFLIAGFHQNLAIPDREMLVQKADTEAVGLPVAVKHGSYLVEA